MKGTWSGMRTAATCSVLVWLLGSGVGWASEIVIQVSPRYWELRIEIKEIRSEDRKAEVAVLKREYGSRVGLRVFVVRCVEKGGGGKERECKPLKTSELNAGRIPRTWQPMISNNMAANPRLNFTSSSLTLFILNPREGCIEVEGTSYELSDIRLKVPDDATVYPFRNGEQREHDGMKCFVISKQHLLNVRVENAAGAYLGQVNLEPQIVTGVPGVVYVAGGACEPDGERASEPTGADWPRSGQSSKTIVFAPDEESDAAKLTASYWDGHRWQDIKSSRCPGCTLNIEIPENYDHFPPSMKVRVTSVAGDELGIWTLSYLREALGSNDSYMIIMRTSGGASDLSEPAPVLPLIGEDW